MLKACAFDLGNTLVNDALLLEEATEGMGRWLAGQGLVSSPQSFIEAYSRINRETETPFISHTYGEPELFERAFAELGIRGLNPGEGLRVYRELVEGRMILDAEVRGALRSVRDQGLKLALLSNESSQRVASFLRLTGTHPLFDTVVVSAEVGFEKPDERIFQELLGRLKVDGSETVLFGDNEVADGACRRLGIFFVLVTAFKKEGWGWEKGSPHKPDFILHRLDRQGVEEALRFAESARNQSPERLHQ